MQRDLNDADALIAARGVTVCLVGTERLSVRDHAPDLAAGSDIGEKFAPDRERVTSLGLDRDFTAPRPPAQQFRADFVVVALEKIGAEEIRRGQARQIGEPEVLAGRLIHIGDATIGVQHSDKVSGPLDEFEQSPYFFGGRVAVHAHHSSSEPLSDHDRSTRAASAPVTSPLVFR